MAQLNRFFRLADHAQRRTQTFCPDHDDPGHQAATIEIPTLWAPVNKTGWNNPRSGRCFRSIHAAASRAEIPLSVRSLALSYNCRGHRQVAQPIKAKCEGGL
ncbi:hypothetical protein RESH_06209 [Rhodopirellula europaea SH398]|uniref:Uncharacterized protein n=1 Tax=Rhodopirellula europaea SH398 TaxID=1263868 RepID=M5S6N6_9BACT|nr:hypothetical protein RESH_06209 [Rhodopirellula europaea SH398]